MSVAMTDVTIPDSKPAARASVGAVVRRLVVSWEIIPHLFGNGAAYNLEVVKDGVPDDARIVDVDVDHFKRIVVFSIASNTFRPEDADLPIEPLMRRRG